MFRFRLRTLLIVLAVLPPLLAGGWYVWQSVTEGQRKKNPAAFLQSLDWDHLPRIGP